MVLCEKTRNCFFSLLPQPGHIFQGLQSHHDMTAMPIQAILSDAIPRKCFTLSGALIYSLTLKATSVSFTLCSKSSQASISTRLFFARNGAWLPFNQKVNKYYVNMCVLCSCQCSLPA